MALWVDEREALATLPLRPPRHACDRGDRHLHARRRRRQARQADAVRRGGPARARRARARSRCAWATSSRGRRAARRACRGATTAWRASRRPAGVPLALVQARRRRVRPRPRRAAPARSATAALAELAAMGFERRDGGLAVSDRELRVVRGRRAPTASGRCSTTSLCSSTRPTRCSATPRSAASRSTTSRTPPTRSPCSCAGPAGVAHRVRRAQAGLRPGLSVVGRSRRRRGRHGRPRGGGRGAPARRGAGRAREARPRRAARCGCRAAWSGAIAASIASAPNAPAATGAAAAGVRAARRGPALARVARRAACSSGRPATR